MRNVSRRLGRLGSGCRRFWQLLETASAVEIERRRALALATMAEFRGAGRPIL